MEKYIKECEGFIVAYSITNRADFHLVPSFIELCKRLKNRDELPGLLMGCKLDLENDRQVSTSEGEERALINGWSFVETSAKTYVHVDEAIYETVRSIRRNRIHYVDLTKTIGNAIIILLLCANRFSAKSRVFQVDINVWRLILRAVYASRMDRELWKPLIDWKREKQIAGASGGDSKKKCVMQ